MVAVMCGAFCVRAHVEVRHVSATWLVTWSFFMTRHIECSYAPAFSNEMSDPCRGTHAYRLKILLHIMCNGSWEKLTLHQRRRLKRKLVSGRSLSKATPRLIDAQA